jgi:hypothetical protein
MGVDIAKGNVIPEGKGSHHKPQGGFFPIAKHKCTDFVIFPPSIHK